MSIFEEDTMTSQVATRAALLKAERTRLFDRQRDEVDEHGRETLTPRYQADRDAMLDAHRQEREELYARQVFDLADDQLEERMAARFDGATPTKMASLSSAHAREAETLRQAHIQEELTFQAEVDNLAESEDATLAWSAQTCQEHRELELVAV
jgi:activator of HSP90 ATPase